MTNANVHLVKTILYTDRPPLRFMRYLLLAALLFTGLLGVRFAFLSLAPPGVYMKDFIQEYLLAQAVVNGVNPYLPLSELADRFIGPLENPIFPHPTPHPPPVILLSLPLAFFAYETAASVWLFFEVVVLFACVYLLLSWWQKRPSLVIVLTILLISMAWNPIVYELVFGQLMAVILLFALAAWRSLQRNWEVAAGIMLGCALALKLVVWPLLFVLLFYRRIWAIVTAGIAFIATNTVVALLIGFDTVWYYYTVVGATVGPLYQADEHNFSLFTIGWRLFFGTGSPIMAGISAPPLLNDPDLAGVVSWVVPLVFLALSLVLTWRLHSFDAAYAIMLCVAVVANPVAWNHYLLLLALPLTIIANYLHRTDLPRNETYLALFILLLLLVPRSELSRLALVFSTGEFTSSGYPIAPFWPTLLLTLLPLFSVLATMALVWRLDALAKLRA